MGPSFFFALYSLFAMIYSYELYQASKHKVAERIKNWHNRKSMYQNSISRRRWRTAKLIALNRSYKHC